MSDDDEMFMKGMIQSNTATNRILLVSIELERVEYDFTLKWCREADTFVAEFVGDTNEASLDVTYEDYFELKRLVLYHHDVKILTNVTFLAEVKTPEVTHLFMVQWYAPIAAMIGSYSGGEDNPLLTTQDVSARILRKLRTLYYVKTIENVYDVHEVPLDDTLHNIGFGWHKKSNTLVARYIDEPNVVLSLTEEGYKNLKTFLSDTYKIERLERIVCPAHHQSTQFVRNMIQTV